MPASAGKTPEVASSTCLSVTCALTGVAALFCWLKGPAGPLAFRAPPPGSCALTVKGDAVLGVRFEICAFNCWYTADPGWPAVVRVSGAFLTCALSRYRFSSIEAPSGFAPAGFGGAGALL